MQSIDPSGDWLDFTNFMLGVATLICIFVVVWAGIKEFAKRTVKKPVADPHALEVPGLGMTMADGGKPLDRDDSKRR